jgi:hypothetical protein
MYGLGLISREGLLEGTVEVSNSVPYPSAAGSLNIAYA